MSDISDIVKISVACATMFATAPETRSVVSHYVNKAKDFFREYDAVCDNLYRD